MTQRSNYEERALALLARKAAADARESDKARAAETRKKIILGGAVLAAVRAGHLDQAKLESWLGEFVRQPRDRELFGLTPLTPSQKP